MKLAHLHRAAATAAALALGIGSVIAVGPASAAPLAATSLGSSLAESGCAASFAVVNGWNGGFQGEVTVENTGAGTLDGWTVEMNLPSGITLASLWNGVVTGASGAVQVTDAGYNGTLGAGQSTSFGFTATGAPSGISVSCPGGTAPSPEPTTTEPTQDPTPSPEPTEDDPEESDVLDQVNTVGRVNDLGGSVQYTWPGVYFEGRFSGTSVGVVLNDATNDYEIRVDDAAPTELEAPGDTTHWIEGLPDGDHTIRIAKRTESPYGAGTFGGLVAGPDGSILAKPAARERQIEFIGDSWTAGYGNASTTGRDCSATGGVDPNSNANQSFGALTARGFDADYQLNAWSGMGMVRNYNGSNAGTSYRTYYDTALQAADSADWQRPASWDPQVIVIGLGINDFSTPVAAGEAWADEAALAADYRTAYLAFIEKLRSTYGADAEIVLTYPDLSYTTTAFADSVEQVVTQRHATGDVNVTSLYYDNNALGLDTQGCDWHPSAQDHEILADALTVHLNSLAPDW